ncbi:hypothetical protein HAX54_052499, partial [Datura stramonium]|nr:hypothetical protein [Datura stramonium]
MSTTRGIKGSGGSARGPVRKKLPICSKWSWLGGKNISKAPIPSHLDGKCPCYDSPSVKDSLSLSPPCFAPRAETKTGHDACYENVTTRRETYMVFLEGIRR